MSYFRAENLSLHFGCLKSVRCRQLAVEKGEIPLDLGPNGAGESSIFTYLANAIPDPGRDLFRGSGYQRQSRPTTSAGLALPHLPNIELFEMPPCCPICWSAGTPTPPPNSGRN